MWISQIPLMPASRCHKAQAWRALKSKNPTTQVNELLAKIIACNLTVVIHEMYENGIQPEFLQLESDVCNQSQAKTSL
jgi:hypothetical protein